MVSTSETELSVAEFRETAANIETEVGKVIVGQADVVQHVLIGILSGGHVLLEGVPGLVEGYGDGVSVGRSYRDAPEIDGLVIVPGELPPGELVPIRLDGAMTYDLTGFPDTTPAQTITLSMIS